MPTGETGRQGLERPPWSRCGEGSPGPAPRPIAATDVEGTTPLGGNPFDDGKSFGELGRDDDRATGFDDAGLLGGDLVDGVAEHSGVFEVEGGDDRDEWGDDIGGIEGTAETDLDNGEVA